MCLILSEEVVVLAKLFCL